MAKKPKLPTDLAPLAAALESARVSNGFNAFIHGEIVSVLLTIFPFGGGLADTERRSALYAGISRAAALGEITAKSLSGAIRLEERALLSAPSRDFLLASHLSFTLHGVPRPTTFKSGIRLVTQLPQEILEARKLIDPAISEDDRLVRNYTGIIARVKARNVGHGFELAINRLDLLRGIWNFAHTRRTIWGSTSDPTTPITRLRFSRIHTLHETTGALATQMYWFNPEFREERFTSLPLVDWQRMQKYLRSVQQRLPRIAYRADLERAFIHYGRALDSTDMESAFLKLWSVLELVSGLGGERYDTLLERAAFLFKPDPLTTYVLEHLRYQRNELAHLGHPQSEMRPLVYQLKRYVEQMIAVHITLGRHFESLDEAGRFMDLADTPTTLQRKRALIDRALLFRRVKKKRKVRSQGRKQ